MSDVGSGGATRHILDPRHLAAGEHDFEPDHHVLDAAVQGRELADAAGRHETSHLCDRLRLRRVSGRQTEPAGAVLEHLQRHAALSGGLHVVGVDADDLVHPRAVEHDRVLDHRLEPTLGRRATGARHHVDPVLVGEREHVGGLVRAAHHHDRGGCRHRVDAEDVLELAEVVDAALTKQVGVGEHLVVTDDLLQLLDDLGSGEGHGDGSLWVSVGECG